MRSRSQQISAFLPDFCGVRMVFVVVLIAELLALVLTLADATRLQEAASVLAMHSLFIQWMALSSITVLCLTRKYLNRLPDYWTATLSYLLVLTTCLLITELSWWLFLSSPALSVSLHLEHTQFLLRCMGISAIVSALALRYFYVQQQWRNNLEMQAQSRIQALQARIRPHFLFNCMNIIASLTRKDPKLAEETVEDLADLFRVSLQDSETLSTLEQEIQLCKRYLRIESYRLGERLQIAWEIGQIDPRTRLPVLTVQPLIENAIYHGVEQLADGGTIRIVAGVQGNMVHLRVENPVSATLSNPRHGNQLAQDNIQQRLHACFGQAAGMSTQIRDNLYIAEIIFPHHVENPDS